jgi:hypothetical protein
VYMNKSLKIGHGPSKGSKAIDNQELIAYSEA